MSRSGDLAAASLGLSGLALALFPERSSAALSLSPMSARGLTELRAGLGGTVAGVGLWAWARGTSDAYTAVGMVCLGAAAARLWSLKVDEPERGSTHVALLAGEIGLGVVGLGARTRGRS